MVKGFIVALVAIVVGLSVFIATGLLFTQEVPDTNSPARTSETGEGTDGFVDFTVKYTVVQHDVNGLFQVLTVDALTVDWKETLGTPSGSVTATVFPTFTAGVECLSHVTMFWADSQGSDSKTSTEKTFTSGGQVTVNFGHLYVFPGDVSATFEISVKGCGLPLYESFVMIRTQTVTLNFDGVNGS